jgi:glycosyltransferase involved in cell wall biosynthesis
MRILLVAPTSPFDTSFGAAQRTTLMYRALLEHGDLEVVILKHGPLFAAAGGERPGEAARLTVPEGPWHSKYQSNPAIIAWAKEYLAPRRYDFVVARELSTAGQFCEAINVPLLADVDDARYRYAPSSSSAMSRAIAVVKTRARAHYTHRALRRFSHVWLACRRDQEEFSSVASTLLPNVVPDVSAEAPPESAAPTILFVGALWYGPNVEAINWFVANCWPAISRSLPDARLRIVGACPVRQREIWSRTRGVECTGFVDDLAAEYRAARFTIAPVRFGGGTQIKTLESLAYERTAVVSSFVFGGYSGAFTAGSSLVVADSIGDTIARCTWLLLHPEQAARLASAGREVVRQHFGWQAFRAGVTEGVAQATARQ